MLPTLSFRASNIKTAGVRHREWDMASGWVIFCEKREVDAIQLSRWVEHPLAKLLIWQHLALAVSVTVWILIVFSQRLICYRPGPQSGTLLLVVENSVGGGLMKGYWVMCMWGIQSRGCWCLSCLFLCFLLARRWANFLSHALRPQVLCHHIVKWLWTKSPEQWATTSLSIMWQLS